ncbi:MAG: PIN domain-containing protein [Acidobacteria bacterium]|nr:PIN domain-containing protein [Acidobacteriota bacterium]
MSAKSFVDTNVLVYARDRHAGAKYATARDLLEQLWAERSGVLSTQVLQEFYVNVRRKPKKPLSANEAREIVSDYLSWDVVVNTGDSVLAAIDLEERFQLSFWDALIVHAAQASGAETLYSEDLADGQQYGLVKVVNPFAGQAAPAS